MFSLALFTAALAQVCDEVNNDADNNELNPDCNNAGICVGGSCQCCDVLTCHPFWVDYPAYAGDTCTTVNDYQFANWAMFIRPKNENQDLGFTCSTDYLAFISNFTTANLDMGSVDMSTQMASTLASSSYGNYGGLTEQVGCLECTQFLPCAFSFVDVEGNTQSVNIQEGFAVIFMTDYNTYYDPECATTERYWDFSYTVAPPDCAANLDYGFSAQDKFKQSGGFYNPPNLGGFDAATIGALFDESIARGTYERPPGLGLDNVETFEVLAQSENYEPIEGVVFNTRSPSASPSPAPTPEPNDIVLVCSEAMWFIAGATHGIPDPTVEEDIASILADSWMMSDLEWSVNGVERSVYYSLYPYTKYMWYELLEDTFVAAGHEHLHGEGAWNIKMGSSTSDPMSGNFTAAFYEVLWDSTTYAKVQGFPATEQSCPEDDGVHWEYFCDACGGWLELAAHEETGSTTVSPSEDEEPMMDYFTDVDTVCSDTINVNTNQADFDSTDLDGDWTRVAGGLNMYPMWSNGILTAYYDGTGASYTDTGNWVIADGSGTQLYTLDSTIKSFCLTFEHIKDWTDVVNGGVVDIRFYDQGNMDLCRTVYLDNYLTLDTTFGEADFCDLDSIGATACTSNLDCDSASTCCFNGCAIQCMALETDSPTGMPSKAPTEDHIDPQTCVDGGYTNNVTDVEVVGGSTSQYGCRGGLEDWWQGGQGCYSPYVVCLPQENTPNGFYYPTDHRYSLDECKEECALDQHCLGAEFKADTDTDGVTPLSDYLGSCTLFLSVPSSGYEIAIDQATFDASLATAAATLYSGYICMNKVNACNPSFSGDELTDEMLECYCPNNRKGVYTKEVTRTVATAVHCGGDSDATASIKKALANRMFEMCESWCLFDFDDPMNVAWFYDPWENCYREQYSSPGPAFHTLYCDAVVRDPYTVEIQYIHLRSMTACDGQKETTTAVSGVTEYTWVMSGEYESCMAACARTDGMLCDPAMTNSVDETMAEATVDSYFTEASVGCNSTYVTAEAGQPAPAYSYMTGECLVFNTATDSDNMPSCNAAVAATYMRLCACYESS